MARTESRTKTSIWNDDEFKELTGAQQHLYWMLYSQSTISLCGVLAYTPGRWARNSSDGSVDEISVLLKGLEKSRHIVVDLDAEEVFVRSFMRNDGVWRSPKTRGAAIGQASLVGSCGIRRAIQEEIDRLELEFPTEPDTQADTPLGTP